MGLPEFTPFSYVLVLDPTVDEFEKQGAQPKMIAEGTVLARSQEDALMLAGQKLTAEYVDQTGRVRTYIRPF